MTAPFSPHILMPTAANIDVCAKYIQQGGLVAFPTETVYGLGADATNDKAVAAIYQVKGRPAFNPLIVHGKHFQDLERLVVFTDAADQLAHFFWPGPLTLVLRRRADCPVSLLVSAGGDTIAMRVPRHPVAQSLLAAAGCPIAAPSANLSGTVSPTTPAHVSDSLGDRVPYILAAGRAPIGLESTVLDMTQELPRLLRHGSILREDIEAIIGPIAADATPLSKEEAPLAPGQLASHYAPRCPVRLNATAVQPGEALLAFGPVFVTGKPAAMLNLSEQGDLVEAAANLFAMLRALDKPEHKGIAVTPIPDTGLGLAINDRLRRAAAPRG